MSDQVQTSTHQTKVQVLVDKIKALETEMAQLRRTFEEQAAKNSQLTQQAKKGGELATWAWGLSQEQEKKIKELEAELQQVRAQRDKLLHEKRANEGASAGASAAFFQPRPKPPERKEQTRTRRNSF